MMVKENKIVYKPFVLKSSTNITSWIKCCGALLITLVAVRSNVDRCSLWKGTTTLTEGNFLRYFFFLQLEIKWIFSFRNQIISCISTLIWQKTFLITKFIQWLIPLKSNTKHVYISIQK